MVLLYGRAGRLTAENGGFRPGQSTSAAGVLPLFDSGELLLSECDFLAPVCGDSGSGLVPTLAAWQLLFGYRSPSFLVTVYEAAGASIAAYSYTLASITTGTGACSLYSEPLRLGISYGAGVFFRLTPDLRGRHLHRLAHRRLRDAALHGHHRRRRRLAHGSGRPGCLSALTVFPCELVFYGAFVWARTWHPVAPRGEPSWALAR